MERKQGDEEGRRQPDKRDTRRGIYTGVPRYPRSVFISSLLKGTEIVPELREAQSTKLCRGTMRDSGGAREEREVESYVTAMLARPVGRGGWNCRFHQVEDRHNGLARESASFLVVSRVPSPSFLSGIRLVSSVGSRFSLSLFAIFVRVEYINAPRDM